MCDEIVCTSGVFYCSNGYFVHCSSCFEISDCKCWSQFVSGSWGCQSRHVIGENTDTWTLEAEEHIERYLKRPFDWSLHPFFSPSAWNPESELISHLLVGNSMSYFRTMFTLLFLFSVTEASVLRHRLCVRREVVSSASLTWSTGNTGGNLWQLSSTTYKLK